MEYCSVIAEIDAQPEGERLEYAKGLIRTMTGGSPWVLAHYQEKLGVTLTEAKLLHHLVVNAPRACTHAQSLSAIYDGDPDVDIKIIQVLVTKIRQRLGPDLPIKTHWGVGYSVSLETAQQIAPGDGKQPFLVPSPPYRLTPDDVRTSRMGDPWTPEDDADLRQMILNGSSLWVIADEMCRTERGVQERMNHLWGVTGRHAARALLEAVNASTD